MFKGRTRTVKHNGANPMWRHRLEVEVVEPSIAILFIAVCHHVRHVVGVARHEVVCEPQGALRLLSIASHYACPVEVCVAYSSKDLWSPRQP